jgi:hypothetical protein
MYVNPTLLKLQTILTDLHWKKKISEDVQDVTVQPEDYIN